MKATKALPSYVYDVSVQCRHGDLIAQWGDDKEDLERARLEARRHAAETGHECEVLVGTVYAYSRSRPRAAHTETKEENQ